MMNILEELELVRGRLTKPDKVQEQGCIYSRKLIPPFLKLFFVSQM